MGIELTDPTLKKRNSWLPIKKDRQGYYDGSMKLIAKDASQKPEKTGESGLDAQPTLPLLNPSESYYNRELGFLTFNRRVLAQANDPKWPLLERLKYLGISSTNLDEFFETRVSLLRNQRVAGVLSIEPDQKSPGEILRQISAATKEIVKSQYATLNDSLLPELASIGINLLPPELWSKEQAAWLLSYFESQVLPVLSPLGLDPAHPFPRVSNKSLNFIVELDGKGAFGRDVKIAIVPAQESFRG